MKQIEQAQSDNQSLFTKQKNIIKFKVDDIDVTVRPSTVKETYDAGIRRLAKYLTYLSEMCKD